MNKALHPMIWTGTVGSSRLVAGLPRRVDPESQESATDFSTHWPEAPSGFHREAESWSRARSAAQRQRTQLN